MGLPNSLFSFGKMVFDDENKSPLNSTNCTENAIPPVDIGRAMEDPRLEEAMAPIDIDAATTVSDCAGNRNWLVILYPDSVPPNWREYLEELHLQWFESPLHDKDICADGSPKKPHWHLVFCFEGKKSYSQMLRILKPLNGPIPKVADNIRGAVRYLAHLDNPDKYQYSATEIVCHGGADLDQYLVCNSYHRKLMLREMQSFVRANNITEFVDLMDYAAQERFEDWYQLLIDNSAMVMDKYICSLRNSMKERFIEERKIFHEEKHSILDRLDKLERGRR